MTHYNGNIDDFGMDSASLAGPLEAKLKAVRESGFTQIMLSATDLVGHPQGMDAAVAAVKDSGLRVTGLQALRDFEGLSGQMHDYKIDIAKSMLEICHALSCRTLIVCASLLRSPVGDTRATMIRDLRKLALLAIPGSIKIAYQQRAHDWIGDDFSRAWDLVYEADMPNLGLGFDACDMIASNIDLDELDMLDPDKLFLVQLADGMWTETDPVDGRRTAVEQFRVFPGEGEHSGALAALITRIHMLGYRGDYSFEVFNNDYQQMPLDTVTHRARRAARWLGESVLQRSVPLPNQIRLRKLKSS